MGKHQTSDGTEFWVDDADDAFVASGRWVIKTSLNTSYVRSYTKPIGVAYLHRLLAEAPQGLVVDHIDGDGLNNRRANLRVSSHRDNMRNQRRKRTNQSGAKGVYWSDWHGRWVARVTVDYKTVHLGSFDTVDEAAAVVCAARERLHGEFANHGDGTRDYDAGAVRAALAARAARRGTPQRRSTYPGVVFDPRSGDWAAYSHANKRRVTIGHFASAEAARDARDEYLNNKTTEKSA